MAVKEIEKITDHSEQAIDRLPQQYKDASKKYDLEYLPGRELSGWEGTIYSFIQRVQEYEDVANDMLTNRSLNTAEGINLERIGEIVGTARQGDDDDTYRQRIIAQIAANNSDTTGDNLLNITNILLSTSADEVFTESKIIESFPAKITIQYAAETKTTLDSSNNSISFQADETGGSPILSTLLTEGDYFPNELERLLEDAFFEVLGQTLPVDFNNGDRTFTVALGEVTLPDPVIYWDTAGPAYGFGASEKQTTTKNGDSIPGPEVDNEALLDTLLQSKAAGVGLELQRSFVDDYFGFSNDSEALGYGSLIKDNQVVRTSNYLTYKFPDGLPDIGFNRYVQTSTFGGGTNLGILFILANEDSDDFENEIQTDGRGYFVVDQAGDEYLFQYDEGTAVDYSRQDQGSQQRFILFMTSGGLPIGRLFKNGVELDYDAGEWETEMIFVFDDWFNGQKTEYDAANNNTLGNDSELRDTVIGGGEYSTIVTRET